MKLADPVKAPSYYNRGKLECFDAIKEAIIGLSGIEAYNTGNIIKYAWRWKFKDGIKDLKKAREYIDKLIEHLENEQKEIIPR